MHNRDLPWNLSIFRHRAPLLERRGPRAAGRMAGLTMLGIALLTSAGAPTAFAAPPAATPPPAVSHVRMDLDAFDALKKTVSLSDGIELAYIDMGDPAGPPVVLIHGFTDNARDWAPMLPHLSTHDRLIIVDIRGHGKSSKPECCYSRLDFAYDIKLLLDTLGIEKTDVVGHSLGSIVAQTFAEYWPQRTRRVVLISSMGGRRPTAHAAPAPEPGYVAAIRNLKEPIDPNSPFMIAWWDSPTPVDPDFIRRERQDAAAIPLRVWLAVIDQSLSARTAYVDLQNTLPRLKAPTLLIWGSKDPIMDEGLRQTLRKGLPAAKVKIFEGLGHNPFWEQPASVAAVVQGFLDEEAASKSGP
ncbi:MAG: alpha/beta hydrolase [Steroidobacteraceae bacterium]|jgi:pimeloyl-ACP methyl ester carboxylesterase